MLLVLFPNGYRRDLGHSMRRFGFRFVEPRLSRMVKSLKQACETIATRVGP